MKNSSHVIAFLSAFFFLSLSIPAYSQASEKRAPERGVRYISGKAKASNSNGHAPKKQTIALERSELKLDADSANLEKETFDLINLRRLERGLKELKWSDELADLARTHSENMAVYGFFSHIGLNGRLVDRRAADSGIDKWQGIGENIAFNKGFANPTSLAVERWMLSAGHKLNLLDSRWTESGLGIAVTKDGKYFFTQIFIFR
ncbi:MAG: CAP domain-containing protein [Acidobacteriota bacterium]|nr:CAP domain-containing protein [Acidobacteriota bacterium]